jgi:hypothetical protein
MVQSLLILSDEENSLLWAIRELGFGELYGVEIKDGTRAIEQTASIAERDLIETIRRGNQYFDVLYVHQGSPIMAEIDFKLNGFRCRKKIRFPTSREEGC